MEDEVRLSDTLPQARTGNYDGYLVVQWLHAQPEGAVPHNFTTRQLLHVGRCFVIRFALFASRAAR